MQIKDFYMQIRYIQDMAGFIVKDEEAPLNDVIRAGQITSTCEEIIEQILTKNKNLQGLL